MAESRHLCTHKVFENAKRTNYTFCINCGCLILKNVHHRNLFAVKPVEKFYKLEIDPYEALKNIKETHERNQKVKKSSNSPIGYASVRRNVIFSLKKFIRKFNFNDEVFHLSLTYIDSIMRYFPNANTIPENKLELLVISCFLLAVKFGVNDPIVPDLNNFSCSSSSFFFNVRDVRKYEDFCVKSLNYELNLFTPYSILQFFINSGIIFEDEVNSNSVSFDESDSCNSFSTEMAYNYAYKLLYSFMCNSKCLDYSPLQIALAIIYQTRYHFGYDNEKTELLFNTIYGYDTKSAFITDCLNTIRAEECFFANSNFFSSKNLTEISNSLNHISPGRVNIGSTTTSNLTNIIKTKSHTSKNIIDICREIEQKLNNHLNKGTEKNSVILRKASNSNLKNQPPTFLTASKNKSTSTASTTVNSISSRSASKPTISVKNCSKIHSSGRLPIVNKYPDTLGTKNLIPIATKKSSLKLGASSSVFNQRNLSKIKKI